MLSFALQRTYGFFSILGKAAVLVFAINFPVFATEPVKILALGDSLTQGYGLAEPDGLVPQLQSWFDQNGHRVTVINAGVSGDTTAGGLDRVEWLLDDDIDMVMVALGGNDMLRGLPPKVSRDNLRGILEILRNAKRQIILVGMTAPSNYGPDYEAEFNAIFPELAKEYGATYIPSYFAPMMHLGLGSAEMRDLMQADAIHPNEKGVLMIVDYIAPIIAQSLVE